MARVVVTATGAGSVAVPAGAYAVDVEAYAAGGSGSRSSSQLDCGGSGGAYAGVFSLQCAPGQTLFWSVGAGGAAITSGSNVGNPGVQSWVNLGSNSAPVSSTTGALAAPGAGGRITSGTTTGGATASCIGTTLFAGGNATASSTIYPGGAGGAGKSGAGANNAAGTGGASGGSPDGGSGGTGSSGGGVAGGAGAQPGGGGASAGTANSGAGGAGQIAYTFYISTATFVPDGGDIAKLATPRRLDEFAAAPVGVPKGEFLPNFLSQWLGQSDIARLPPIRPVDDVRNPPALIVVAVVPNYVSQWLGQSDILRLPPIKPLDDVRNPPAVANGEFLASFVSQWLGQTDIARLKPPRPLDNLEGPVGVAKGEFLSSFVSQWLGQSDPPKLPPPRALDNPAAPLGYLGEFIPSLVSQWLGQSDVARLPAPRPLDNPAAPLGYAGEFTPSFISQWDVGGDVFLPRRLFNWDSAVALARFIVPPPPPPPAPPVFSGVLSYLLQFRSLFEAVNDPIMQQYSKVAGQIGVPIGMNFNVLAYVSGQILTGGYLILITVQGLAEQALLNHPNLVLATVRPVTSTKQTIITTRLPFSVSQYQFNIQGAGPVPLG